MKECGVQALHRVINFLTLPKESIILRGSARARRGRYSSRILIPAAAMKFCVSSPERTWHVRLMLSTASGDQPR
jgi:hypothetical protein